MCKNLLHNNQKRSIICMCHVPLHDIAYLYACIALTVCKFNSIEMPINMIIIIFVLLLLLVSLLSSYSLRELGHIR